MAPRIRSLKPELPHDEGLARCTIAARYLFVLLITQADDEGRLRAAPSWVRSTCFPYDDDLSAAFVADLLDELAEHEMIRRWHVSDQRYMEIINFGKHQRIDKPRPSQIPRPSRGFDEPSPTVPGHVADGSGVEGSGEGGGVDREVDQSSRPPSATADLDLIECEHLANLIEANGSKRPTITAAWLQAADRMKRLDGREHGAILKAIEWCQADEFWRANILSMPKLREQYDRLRLAAERARRAPSTRDDARSAASDYRRRVAAGEEG